MKLSTTKCRQLPIVTGDICGVDTDAEKEMKSEEQGKKGMAVFTAGAGRCKWSVIADLERFEQMVEFLFNVACVFEHTSMQSEKTLMRHAEREGCIPKVRVTNMTRT